MRTFRYGLVVLSLLLCMGTSAEAEVGVSIGIELPHASIGINVSDYPEFVLVPGYPVYYAPRIYANYFFYDGMYWVYQDDNWFASYWFNGPWWFVEPEFVPLFILRVPVFYYMQPPVYFRGWHVHKPPRWGEHWGHAWEQRRRGWDRWEHRSAPPPAPLPIYQRQYSGEKYPRVEQQQELRNRYYRYQPRDKAVREYIRPRVERKAPGPAQPGKFKAPQMRGKRQPDSRYSRSPGQSAPAGPGSPPHRGFENRQRQSPAQAPPQQRRPALQGQRRQPGDAQREREQLAPRAPEKEPRSRDRGGAEEPKRGYGPGQGKDGR